MGYVSDRGALGVLTPALTPMQSLIYTRTVSPTVRTGLLKQWGIVDIPPASVKIAPLPAPSTNPIIKMAQGLLPTTAPVTAPAPVTLPSVIQKAAPVVPVLLAPSPAAAAAAVVQPIVEAASAPPTVKIRLSPASTTLTPVDTPMPAGSGGGGAAVFNADGSTAGAAAAPPADDLLASLKNLPPVALLAVALGALVLFGRK